MIVDKSRFEKKGLKCDKYAKYLENFDLSEKGNHHVYLKSIFKTNNDDYIQMTPQEHAHVHLLLALENLSVESINSAKVMMSVSYLYNIGTLTDKDKKLYEKHMKRIKEISSIWLKKERSERFNNKEYYDKCTANLMHDPEECRKRSLEMCKDKKYVQRLREQSKWDDSNFQQKIADNKTQKKIIETLAYLYDNKLEFNKENFSEDSRPSRQDSLWYKTIYEHSFVLLELGMNKNKLKALLKESNYPKFYDWSKEGWCITTQKVSEEDYKKAEMYVRSL